MNCEQVRGLLSAYFDGELSGVADARHQEVRDHVASCEWCAKELGSFEQLRQLATAKANPQLRPPSWGAIASRLDDVCRTELAAGSVPSDRRIAEPVASAESLAGTLTKTRRMVIGGMLTLAASAVLFFSLRQSYQPRGDTVFQAGVATINLQPLLELFNTDSEKALQTLASQHPTTDVSVAQAEAKFGRPIFLQTSMKSNVLPGNARMVSTKLIRFPFCKCPKGACTCGPGGCNCVACFCERPDGSTYLVLEHCKSQSVTFGDLPVQIVKRGDRHLQQVEVEGTLVISWENNGERLTAIGLRGPQEIETLLASR